MRKKHNLIAIDPGLRETGIAHFYGEELVDYGVKSLRRPGKAHSRLQLLTNIIARIIKEKTPTVMAIEKNNFSQIQQNLPLMIGIQRIKGLAKRNNIPLYEFAPNTIKKEVTDDGRATKKQIVRVICSRIPELTVYRESNRRWRERYYQNMFDAVACGLTYLKLHAEKRLYK